MKGPRTDPAKIKLSQTRSRNPGAAEVKRVSKVLADAAESGDGGRVIKDGKGNKLVGSRRTDSPFLAAIRHLKSVNQWERKLIEMSHGAGFGMKDAAAFWMYQFIKLEKARKADPPEIDGKTYMIGINQLLTAATKLAEVSARLIVGEMPSEISVVFDIAKTMSSDRATSDEPDPINGDPIEVA